MQTLDVCGLKSNPAPVDEPQTSTRSYSPTQSKTSRRGYIVTLLGLALVQFSTFVSIFVLDTFFLQVCAKRHVSGIQGGGITGVLQGFFIITSYLFLGSVHMFPMKTLMIGGQTVAGICLIFFAFLDRIDDNVWFVVACLITRTVQGFGIIVSDVCALAVANKKSPPEALSTIIGFMELSVALGQAVAPPLGGILFEVGGFYTPFLASAALMFLSALVCIPTIPNQVKVEKKSITELVKNTFQIKLYCVIFIICGGFLGFFNGMIEPHFRQFHLTPSMVGVVILVTNVFSGVTFPVWGHICDSVLKPTTVTFISCAIGGIGFILFGPFPYSGIPNNIWIMAASLALSGTAVSGVIISSYGQTRTRLGVLCRTPENADTLMSAAYIAFCNFGYFLGAVLGGIFIDKIGFSNGAAVLFGIQMSVVVVQLMIMWQRRKNAIHGR